MGGDPPPSTYPSDLCATASLKSCGSNCMIGPQIGKLYGMWGYKRAKQGERNTRLCVLANVY